MKTPPYRIETERLVIRCYEPSDAPLLKAAVDTSHKHLIQFMSWALNDPEPLENKINLLRTFRALFDKDEDYIYGIFNKAETELLGGTGLHKRPKDFALEIGYWINVHHTRKGIASEISQVLSKVAFEYVGVNRMQINCDEANVISAKIPKNLGYQCDAILKNRHIDLAGNYTRNLMTWSLFKEDYEALSWKNIPIEAFDVMGQKVMGVA